MNSGKIVHLTSEAEFQKEVLKSQIPVIVDFYADWCGPCKKLAPELESLCNSQKTFKLVKVNVEQAEELSTSYSVSSIPLVILFHEGKEVMKFKGYDVDSLKEMIAKCKALNKSAGFEGQGISIGGPSDNNSSAASRQEINNLQASIPNEPAEGTPGCYTIVFKNSENSFQRRFNAEDTINDLKNFVKLQMKTNSNVELFENLPRKVYSNNSATLNKSGLSTYQMLFFSFN